MRCRSDSKEPVLAKVRSRHGAIRELNNIIWNTGSSISFLKVILDKIKNFRY